MHRELVLQRAADLPRVVGGLLLSLTDTADFKLGFAEPTTLSSLLESQFSQFYASLIEGLPLAEDEKTTLIIIGVLN